MVTVTPNRLVPINRHFRAREVVQLTRVQRKASSSSVPPFLLQGYHIGVHETLAASAGHCQSTSQNYRPNGLLGNRGTRSKRKEEGWRFPWKWRGFHYHRQCLYFKSIWDSGHQKQNPYLAGCSWMQREWQVLESGRVRLILPETSTRSSLLMHANVISELELTAAHQIGC